MNEPERMHVHRADWQPFPEFGGSLSTLHESADGKVVAASYRLSGRHTWTLAYDDYFYVIAGSATVTVDDKAAFGVAAGDFCHLTQGSEVTFDMSEDFHEVSVLVADAPIDVTEL